jgi:hypothetical protein
MNLIWIQAVRIAQIIFGLIVLALTAYGASLDPWGGPDEY